MNIQYCQKSVEPTENTFVLVVYPCPQDSGEVFGYLDSLPVSPPDQKSASFLSSGGFGVTAVKAVEMVKNTAKHYGIPNIMIADPDGLLPDWEKQIS